MLVSILMKTGSDSHPNTATDSRRKTATQQRQQMGESSVGLSGCSRPIALKKPPGNIGISQIAATTIRRTN